MDRITRIRSEEKTYHDYCYDHFELFEPGSWLHKPVKTVLGVLDQFRDHEYVNALDLGAGVGRNSIPIAQSLRGRNGRVVCVDLLESAIQKLLDYAEKYDAQTYIQPVLSDIEHYVIDPESYDMIVAVSALEHLRSEYVLEQKLNEMVLGTKNNGVNCIIISSNIREVVMDTNQQLGPMFEVNLSTETMLRLLDACYEGWEIQRKSVNQQEYEIMRPDQAVKLTGDIVTYVAKRT
jgi:2-polyprenyl-3-methyl-5-hydroxy-6-metoxy-1,4-benzoquinol methylase